MTEIKFKHIPVMTKEVIEFLKIKENGIYVDGTLGGGGHAQALLGQCQNLNLKCQIIGIDQDEEAISFAKEKLKKYSKNIIFVHDNFQNLNSILSELNIDKVDGILLDLGISSYQLDAPERGFSFKSNQTETSFDMRMDKRQKLSAYEVINQYSEKELKKIFFELGEEPFARQIARQIVIRRQEKPIAKTNELISVIKSATPPKYRYSRRAHFASKVFRAIRMEVNHELEALNLVLPQAVERLKKGGRLLVISFHSLEDRIVKHFFREQNEDIVEVLTKKPITPTQEEITLNPRSDSAKIRVIKKII